MTLTAPGKQDYAMFGGTITLGANTKCETGTAIPSLNNYVGAHDAAGDKTVLRFVHESTSPTATVGDVTIDGTTGTAIADKEVIITLANDTAPRIGSVITLATALIIKIPAASLASGSDSYERCRNTYL